VLNVLSKITVCRTSILDGRLYACPNCGSQVPVYNSCGDRHGPQCSGARRADWLNKTRELLLPGVHYFQVIFTLPDKLSSLILGNRKLLYTLLCHTSWKSLEWALRQQGIQAAALLVLHTWNQQLDHHPHIHALVPGGGPALDGSGWVTSQHPTDRKRVKPFLVDNVQLGRVFRRKFLASLRRLVRRGKLKLEREWSRLLDPSQLTAWLSTMKETDWNVFIEGPPNGRSNPEQVLRYLARYLTGGPISDPRLVRHENGQVTFLARSQNKRAGNPPEEVTIPGTEFVRRWSLHILPKGFTKSRRYGGYHGSKRKEYLDQCRQRLPAIEMPQANVDLSTEPKVQPCSSSPKCPRCNQEMTCIESKRRPSWRNVFGRRSYSTHRIILPVHGGASRYPDD
jgi:hypothetical protein